MNAMHPNFLSYGASPIVRLADFPPLPRPLPREGGGDVPAPTSGDTDWAVSPEGRFLLWASAPLRFNLGLSS